ncbi:hypothetical protein BDY24DRAFT_342432, partial [Mrakia frigida]|uniref:uncharacterized protein n=1 Tax=Mrakia frigida TaxID=29902 RepID=UPI003FCC0415
SKEWNWDDEQEVKKGYYGEIEELLKRVTGCARVVIFDHTVQRTARTEDEEDSPTKRHPVPAVHIAPKAGLARLHKHLDPADVPAALAHRSQLINVWKPLGDPEKTTVEDWPLAIADANTVKDEDKIPCDLVSNVYPTGETYRVLYSNQHKWYYLARQTPKEYILIKCFDSTRPDKIVPHTAFDNKDAREGAPGRESVEVRCLVLYDE